MAYFNIFDVRPIKELAKKTEILQRYILKSHFSDFFFFMNAGICHSVLLYNSLSREAPRVEVAVKGYRTAMCLRFFKPAASRLVNVFFFLFH